MLLYSLERVLARCLSWYLELDKYSAVTFSIRSVFADLHVMVVYNHTFSLRPKTSLAESFQLQHEFPGETKKSQDPKHPWDTLQNLSIFLPPKHKYTFAAL